MKILNAIKKLGAIVIMAIAATIPFTSCSNGGKIVDYVAQTHIATEGWKTSDFLSTGTGVATLRQGVDGDTAHFYVGKSKEVISGRFNGVDTPESTGVIEEWGKEAAKFTTDILTNAKTIILETDTSFGERGPEKESNGRYLVWVWTSERSLEEEDGSQLTLLNLRLVQEGYSPAKSIAGKAYESIFIEADAQAQRLKLHIWSKEKDPNFYYGDAIITSLQTVFSDPESYKGKKVYLEGYISRTMGTDAYIQDTFEEEDGSLKSYGAYIFTMYKEYSILKKGNHIGVTGVISEHYGSYQIVDVKYNPLMEVEDGMKIVGDPKEVEPLDLTVKEAQKGENMGVLIRLTNLSAAKVNGYYGYGGLDETNKEGAQNKTNSMTIYMKDTEGNTFNIRIDDKTFIKQANGYDTIRSYRYFSSLGEGVTFDFIGVMGKYENDLNGKSEVQLMLISTKDITYHNLPADLA